MCYSSSIASCQHQSACTSHVQTATRCFRNKKPIEGAQIDSLIKHMGALQIAPKALLLPQLPTFIPITNPNSIVAQAPTAILLHNTLLARIPPTLQQLIFSYATPSISSSKNLHTFIHTEPHAAQKMLRPLLQAHINALPDTAAHTIVSKHVRNYLQILQPLLLKEEAIPFQNSHRIALRINNSAWDLATISKLGLLFPKILFLDLRNISHVDAQRLYACVACFQDVRWIKLDHCHITSDKSLLPITQWTHCIGMELLWTTGLSNLAIRAMSHATQSAGMRPFAEVSLVTNENLSLVSCASLFKSTLRAHISISPLRPAGLAALFQASPCIQTLYVDVRSQRHFQSLCIALQGAQCLGLLSQLQEVIIYGDYCEQKQAPFSFGDPEINYLIKMVRPIKTIGFIRCAAITQKGIATLQTAWKTSLPKIILGSP